MTDIHAQNRSALNALRAAQYNFDPKTLRHELDAAFAPDATVHLCHPIGTFQGPAALWDKAYAPLAQAMPDLERRDYITIAGPDEDGAAWVGCGGFYCGTHQHPFLDIPPTGHLAHMRFHEFYRMENGQITEMQAIWDIPELMMQAHAWPMSPALGREWCPPAPATQDGMITGPRDATSSAQTRQIIIDMLTAMTRHPNEPPEAMEMERFWHPRMNWYGPAGIGTARGIAGFRNWHQIPFLAAMPDRGQYPDEIKHHFFADGPYCGVTGWPDMAQTLSGAGWLGIPPMDKKITMRSLDFWRVEGDKIRENWVLVDLLHVYDQLGVDVLARMREFNKARPSGTLDL
jgi:predicted ester cyclase